MALTDYVIMPGADYQAICDSVRAKTGGTEPLKSGEVAAAIEGIQAGDGGEGWIEDGNTHIWITLGKGRTSPMLGVCPSGTVTVDWGDGTEPDVLTGTSTSTVVWTPTHEYASAGDYVINLTVDGKMGLVGNKTTCILRHTSSDSSLNTAYQNAIKKMELGDGVTDIGAYAFANCYSLVSIKISDEVRSIGSNAFVYCYSLASINIPDGVTSIGDSIFDSCYSLASVKIPDGVTRISGYAFNKCYALSSINIPGSVTSIAKYAFSSCSALASIDIPEGVTSIGDYAFQTCRTLTSIKIPNGVTTIGNSVFNNCYGVRYYDFSSHTEVPTLSNTNAFTGIAADCEIQVPAALYDEWIAATNWATYADYIVSV